MLDFIFKVIRENTCIYHNFELTYKHTGSSKFNRVPDYFTIGVKETIKQYNCKKCGKTRMVYIDE